MAKIVFGSDGAAARNTLNRITHKHILNKVSEKIDCYAMQGYSCVIVDAPLLFESGFDKLCRFTVCVTASDETSVRRIVRRDGISETDARRRLLTQIPAKELIARCDFHILNEMGADTLDGQIAQVIASMREKAGESR